jgi:hypothetical protein
VYIDRKLELGCIDGDIGGNLHPFPRIGRKPLHKSLLHPKRVIFTNVVAVLNDYTLQKNAQKKDKFTKKTEARFSNLAIAASRFAVGNDFGVAGAFDDHGDTGNDMSQTSVVSATRGERVGSDVSMGAMALDEALGEEQDVQSLRQTEEHLEVSVGFGRL